MWSALILYNDFGTYHPDEKCKQTKWMPAVIIEQGNTAAEFLETLRAVPLFSVGSSLDYQGNV